MQNLCICVLVILVSFTHSFRIITVPEYSAQNENGSNKEFQATRNSEHGDKGEKGYQSHRATEQGEKGHSNKERHQRKYAEAVGDKKSYNHNNGYNDEKHKNTKAQEGYHYANEGSYAKGHDTKGHHNIHKLNEFNKSTDFFDEDRDNAHKENHGGFEEGEVERSGAVQKNREGKRIYFQDRFGKFAEFNKGDHSDNENGFDKKSGRNTYNDEGNDYAAEVEQEVKRNFKILSSEY